MWIGVEGTDHDKGDDTHSILTCSPHSQPPATHAPAVLRRLAHALKEKHACPTYREACTSMHACQPEVISCLPTEVLALMECCPAPLPYSSKIPSAPYSHVRRKQTCYSARLLTGYRQNEAGIIKGMQASCKLRIEGRKQGLSIHASRSTAAGRWGTGCACTSLPSQQRASGVVT